MGLITGLLTLPISPVRGLVGAAEAQRRCRAANCTTREYSVPSRLY